jgi:predicted metal-dependent phosphoesterase TrpH
VKCADLHIHSSYSDGALSPHEIIAIAKKENLKCISITDHDCIESQYQIQMELQDNKDLIIIPGVEISAKYKECEVHILGYYIDIYNQRLKSEIEKLHNSRINRSKEIIYNLNKFGIDLDIDQLLATNSTIGRGNIAQMMVDKGYVADYKAAFNSYLSKGKCAYVEGEKLDYKEVLSLINECGGISVLAHPGKIYKNIGIESIIKEFKSYGMKGLEVYHPSHSIEQRNYFYNLSKKYKLLITGGSDFHSYEKSKFTIGSNGINEELLNKLIYYKQKL